MAVVGEEVEYESDPEDTPLPSMRRREASDDEDGEGSDGRDKPVRKGLMGSDAESDGQGGAQVYEDEEFDPEEEEEEEEEEFEEEDEVEGELEEEEEEIEEVDGGAPREAEVTVAAAQDGGRDSQGAGAEQPEHEGKVHPEEEEKKESEPYAVPTAGAFYMHDDRFRENGRGRHRRFPGGRKLWESKDDRAWVHDRFEELNLQDARHDEERRTSRGRFRGRGRGKTRGGGRGYTRGNRSRAYDDSKNQNRAPKSVRGRGPRRYETLPKNRSEIPATSNKQYAKPHELTSNNSTGRQPGTARQTTHTSNVQPDPASPRKHVFASSLSSASPPFYPSGSSNQDISITHKKDAQAGIVNRIHSSSMQTEENLSIPQSSPLLRGKAAIDSGVHDRLYIDDTVRPAAGKTLSSSQLQTPMPSLSPSNAQSSHSRAQGRGITISGPPNYQPAAPFNQGTRVSVQTQPAAPQQRVFQSPVQPALRISTQQMTQRPGSGTQAPSQSLSTTLSEVGDEESPPGSSKSKATSVGKGQTGNQGSGRGSFLYGGAQVIGATGAMGFTHGDQSFPATPALLPVMQFGGQHGGLGVPAVGMALPGYVAQQQLGFGNSEMTWVPVLAGPAGALGASYPYFTLDSSHYARPSSQPTSSVSSSRETSTMKPGNTLQPPQRTEIVNDEFGQRQHKPRRYSEMNFGQ